MPSTPLELGCAALEEGADTLGGVSASDFTPASQQRDVAVILAKQTKDTRDALQRLIAGDLARLNAQLRAKGLKTIELGTVVF